jgi:hypothetical protein
MKTVYVITSGSGEDFNVSNVFTTRELAQKFIDSFKGSYTDFEIVEFETNPYKRELEAGMKYYNSIMKRCGEWDRIVGYTYEDVYTNRNFKYSITKERVGIYFKGWANSEEEVFEILDRERTRLISKGLWSKAEQDKIDAEIEADKERWRNSLGVDFLNSLLSSEEKINPDGTIRYVRRHDSNNQ